jgi:hypothetical protein
MLRFLSRVALICNACFLLALFILWLKHPPEGELVSLVIILGYVLAMFINGIVNIWYAILLVSRKSLKALVPVWLMTANFIFFVVQLVLFFR